MAELSSLKGFIEQSISTIIRDFEQVSLFDENIVCYLRHAVLTSFDLRDEYCSL